MSDPPTTKYLPKVPLNVVKILCDRYTTFRESDHPSDYSRFLHYLEGVVDTLDLSFSGVNGEIREAYEGGPTAVAALLDKRKRMSDAEKAYKELKKGSPDNVLANVEALKEMGEGANHVI